MTANSDNNIEHINNGINHKSKSKYDILNIVILMILIIITIFSYPTTWNNTKVTIQHVWFYGWITAISTGLGVIPFLFVHDLNKFWMGISNGIAGGMMTAASYSLIYEGASFSDDEDAAIRILKPFGRTVFGIILGIGFILITKKVLSRYDDVSIDNIDRINTQKMILIIFVMTLHSLTEGIGIGVSFGGKSGVQLGQFISLSLAVHNIPEGLAVALVLTARKFSKLQTGLWAIFTSLPQPIMAIPAFIFIEKFVPFLPCGLGFAAGAMAYVAIFELLAEGIEDTSLIITSFVSLVSFIIMMTVQEAVKVSL